MNRTSSVTPASTRRDFLTMASCLVAATVVHAQEQKSKLFFACSPDNDLFQILSPLAHRFDSAEAAIENAPLGSGVLILADQYPQQTTHFNAALVEIAVRKQLRVYLEFPSWLPYLQVGFPSKVHKERIVIVSKRFSPDLMPMRIISANECYYVPVNVNRPEMVLARVAGCETAVYGLPEDEVHPILFEHTIGALMVATTKLSLFRIARYGPTEAWTVIWNRLLEWLCKGIAIRSRPTVYPAFAPNVPLPHGTEMQAFRRGVQWYTNANLLIDPSWDFSTKQALTHKGHASPAGPGRWPVGDGRMGLIEGYRSSIDLSGSQPVASLEEIGPEAIHWELRSDCIGESSFAFALAGDAANRQIAANLNDFIYLYSTLAGESRADPTSSAYGLLDWHTESNGIYYGDDNARSLLGTIGAAAALNSNSWDDHVLRCILANFRTTGPLGFRTPWIKEAELEKNGWQHYFELESTNFSPHFQAYMWAIYLWAYHKTSYLPFLTRTKAAIRKIMDAYPNQWSWTNGIQQERARMLLPLAWLVRVEDNAEHRQWLALMTQEVLRSQQASGAILEEIGKAGQGRFPPPTSNEKYGTAEAPLIQENGDPICDLLYTCNFAFLGLHEAAEATKDNLYSDAEDKLADLLCRIQVCSKEHPELDGAWYRAFDCRLWDYWGSNSDAGWGAWSIETGWTQAWITSVLGLRQRGTSLWDLTASSKIGGHMDQLKPLFIPD